MCFTSAVFDQYQQYIPQPQQWQPTPSWPTPAELRELIDSFNRAFEAAKTFDRLTKQPDCEDPDKAKLLDRIALLEKRLDAVEAGRR